MIFMIYLLSNYHYHYYIIVDAKPVIFQSRKQIVTCHQLKLKPFLSQFILSIGLLSCIPKCSYSIDYDQYSETYDSYNGKTVADLLDIKSIRKAAGKYIKGNVLEIAVGTGLQSEYNDWSSVTSYTAVDGSQGMLSQQASKKLSSTVPATIAVRTYQADVASMDFADKSFDTVIDTFSFCVFEDPSRVMQEISRVTTDDGRIILAENTRSDNSAVGLYQDISEPLVTPLSKGCRWNVDVAAIAKAAGLEVEMEQRDQLGTLMVGVYRHNKH